MCFHEIHCKVHTSNSPLHTLLEKKKETNREQFFMKLIVMFKLAFFNFLLQPPPGMSYDDTFWEQKEETMLRRNLMESQFHNGVRRAQDDRRASLQQKKYLLEDELQKVNNMLRELDIEGNTFRLNNVINNNNNIDNSLPISNTMMSYKPEVLRDRSVNVSSGLSTGRKKTLVREQDGQFGFRGRNSSIQLSVRSSSDISDRPVYPTGVSPLPVRYRPSTVYSTPAVSPQKIAAPRKVLTSPLPPAALPESPNIVVVQSPGSNISSRYMAPSLGY